MRQNIGTRLAAAALAGIVGIFLTIRAKAFLIQAFELDLSVWVLYGVIALLALGAAVFAEPLRTFFKRWVRFPSVGAAVVCGLSVLAMIPLRGIMLRALQDSEVGMSAGTRWLYLLGGGLLLGTFLMCMVTALRERLPGLRRFCRSIDRWDWVFLLVLLAAVNLVVWLYASHSSTIYFWDNAGYWNTSHHLARQWREEGLASLLASVYDSVLTQDYNYLIVLPAVLFTRLFGESRYVFLAAIANFGYYPICILVWGFAKSLGKRPKLTAAAVLLALPMLLYNVLVGFVDVAGCIFTLGALLLFYGDHGRNDFGRFLLAGACLAAAVLLRRWYAFYALAFVLALAIDCLCFRRSAVPLLGVLASFAFILLFFFQPLVSERLLADYGTMYEAYALGLDRDFLLVFYYFGTILLALSLGENIYLIVRRESRSTGVFLMVQTLLCFILFVWVQTHGQQHLLLYVPTEIFLVLFGLLQIQSLRREKAVAITLAVALIPSLSPFFPRGQIGSLNDLNIPEPLPAFSWQPPQRTDADQVVALIRRLDEFGEDGKTVALLASSFGLNWDILTNAEASLSLPRVSQISREDYLMTLPQVDQRDGWWDTLFYCDILVVADPVQLHLGAENQAVIDLPAQALLSGTGFAAAYTRLDEAWTVGDMTVYFYEKVREPTQEEQDALREQFFALHPNALYNGS